MTTSSFDEQKLRRELKIHAKALNIPSGSAEAFIDRTLADAQKTLKSKQIITDRDLDRAIIKELKKYHQDFAYVYQNRDKII